MTTKRHSLSPRNACPLNADVAPDTAELIVGLGFRLWYRGCTTGQLVLWERAWQLYVGALGVPRAQLATNQLSCWVRSLSQSATRDLKLNSNNSATFCRDEQLAISMIAACQHNACPAMRACAFALIENSNLDTVVRHSENFAGTLSSVNVIVPPAHIVNAATFNMPAGSRYYQ